MKKKSLFLLLLALISFNLVNAQSYPVTLKVVDETKKTTVASDAAGSNVIVSISENLQEQNPRNPAGDWWYPMYADAGVTPKGIYTENANDVTWAITFNAEPGEYVWIPFMKSLGWKFLNNAFMYSTEIDNPEIRFTVNADGSVTGTTTITVPKNPTLFNFSVKVIDKTKGELTNEIGTDNEDKNIYTWISGNVSQSTDWWTALYYDASYGPTSELVKGANDWTWQANFQGPAGVYEWNPSIKSWGWATLNGNIGDVKWEGSNLKFIVGLDGTVTGDNVLIVNKLADGYKLTLNLDMTGVTVDPAGVHVVGSFNGWDLASAPQLTDADGDGIYSVDLQLAPSSEPYQYKFMNGQEWDAGKDEAVFGNCAYRSNRLVWIENADVVVDAVTLGNCAEPMPAYKVACIGDSNTEGAGVSNAMEKSWPMQMRDFLTDDYYTDNLGVSGATLMKFPEPWGAWTNNVSGCYENNKKLDPNVILIALGTNDSKTGYWGTRDFKAEYMDLVNEFRAFSSNPEIFMVIPIKAYPNGFGISDDNIRNGIIPAINELSKTNMLPVIDWYSITSSLNQGQYIPDGVHANDETSRMIAEKAAKILMTEKPVISVNGSYNVSYAEYRWYLNGAYINNSNAQTYSATQSGKYNLAVKLTSDANDIIISKELEVNVPAGQTVVLGLGDPSGITPEFVSNYVITSEKGVLNVSGSYNSLKVFDLRGNLVAKSNVSGDSYSKYLGKGLYILSIDNTAQKVIVK